MNPASHTASVSAHAGDFSASEHASRPASVAARNIFISTTETSPSVAPIITCVTWASCLLVGVLGFVLPYTRPRAPVVPPEPVVVEKLAVEMVNDPLPASAAPADSLSAPPPPSSIEQPQVAQVVAVAEPSAVAFALPVEGPTTTVATAHAAHARPAIAAVTTSSAGLPAPQTLVFGQGDGRQPAPEYPARAAKLGQEGTVDIRLTVDPSGHVVNTAVATPCAWPMLNDAAERTVRHRWRFSRGSTRVYDVAIRFALAR